LFYSKRLIGFFILFTMDNKDLQLYKYLNNELNEAEKADFEAVMEADPQLKADVLWNKIADHALWNAPQENTTTQGNDTERLAFREIGKSLIEQEEKKKPNFQMYIIRAIAAILLVGTCFWLFGKMNNPTPSEALFIKYYNAPSIDSNLGVSDNLIWQKTKKDFGNQKFDGLAEKLSTLLVSPDFQQRDQAFFMQGIIYLNEKESTKAIHAFAQVGATNIRLKQNAEWYTALAFLRNAQNSETKNALDKIIQTPNHEFMKEATQLRQVL
jgi:hypothetical protein